jgi:cytochrome c peroxidase
MQARKAFAMMRGMVRTDSPEACMRRAVIGSVVVWAVGTAIVPMPSARAEQGAQPAHVEAGRRLFFDGQLSEPPGTSCASCHDPARAFTGDNGSGRAVPRGSRPGMLGLRNAPTLMYLASSPGPGFSEKEGRKVPSGGFFWDGRAATLAQQALGPLFTPHEMNNQDPAALVARVARSDAAPWLRKAFGDDVFADPGRALEAIASALAAFEQSPAFAPFSSKFDAVLRGQARFTPQEERGQSLFTIAQKGNCAACHTLKPDSRDPRDSLFTDYGFHALGVPRNSDVAQSGQFDLGFCTTAPDGAAANERWCGWFKTPTLRNVAQTAPYMHAGQFATLAEVLTHYNEGGLALVGHNELAPLDLTEHELAQIEAFLRTLTAPPATDPQWLAPPADSAE